MSCHTWAYRKVKNQDFPEFKKDVLERVTKCWDYIPEGVDPFKHVDEKYAKLMEVYKPEDIFTKEEFTEEILGQYLGRRQFVKDLEACESLKDFVKKDMEVGMNRYYDGIKYIFRGESLYVECGNDEPVRIYGYPVEQFTDAEEFINWIKKKESKGKTISRLYDDNYGFIDGICGEMEKAIRDFWEKYDNEVYIEFG